MLNNYGKKLSQDCYTTSISTLYFFLHAAPNRHFALKKYFAWEQRLFAETETVYLKTLMIKIMGNTVSSTLDWRNKETRLPYHYIKYM